MRVPGKPGGGWASVLCGRWRKPREEALRQQRHLAELEPEVAVGLEWSAVVEWEGRVP